jgi:hypothetical protein
MFCLTSRARQLSGISTNIATSAGYVEVSRGPHSRIMQGTKVWINAAGRTVTNTAYYTELCSGMSVLDNDGHWAPASDQIHITSFGAEGPNSQTPARFAANLNSAGAIDLTMPDGRHLTETPLFLSYYDGTSNVLIAELQDTIGTLLPSGNQIIYANAFSGGVAADVRYDFSLSGLEQDVILESQLPDPQGLGLGSNVWIQVWSEFTSAATPAIIPMPGSGDEWLDFGTLQMGSGRTFSLGTNGDSVPTTKTWRVMDDGRRFLVEQVPLQSIWPQLQSLPPPAPSGSPAPGNGAVPIRYRPSRQQNLPKRRLAKKSASPIRVAKGRARAQGLVIDYATINSTQTNYTYMSDTTYYISGPFNSYGTNTFEGGTVVKFATNATLTIATGGPGSPQVIWKGSSYRPVVCTAKDDNGVGDPISGSTGNPTGYYGGLSLANVSTNITGFRSSFASNGIALTTANINMYDAQFVNCENCVSMASGGVTLSLKNALFANAKTNFIFGDDCVVDAQNATFGGSTYLSKSPPTQQGCELSLTNCILANILQLTSGVFLSTNGDYNGIYGEVPSMFGTHIFSTAINPFETIGAGDYYLADGCVFRNLGTTNIAATLLADLQQKTTYPPLFINGGTGAYYTNDLTLYPQAQRENGDGPDLGYHYDPIDFAFSGIFVTNSTFTVMPGTVIAALVTNGGAYGLTVGNGGQFLCQGTPTSLCRIVNFNTVQEQYTTNFISRLEDGLLLPNYSANPPPSIIECRFTDFSILAQDANFLFEDCGCADTGTINLQDCQFHGGIIMIFDPTVNLTNCLFERVYSQFLSTDGNVPVARNNLFYGGTFDFAPSVTNSVVQDNVFNLTSIPPESIAYYGGFNAFITNCDRLLPTNSTDLVLTNIAFQTGPLGYYYYPTNTPLTPLIDGDTNTTAAQVGLFHYTTTTNQVKETNSPLDIGYHYVALGANGLPVDTTGCGTPDYLRDANGNGLVDSGELSWTNAADLGLNIIITRPQNNSIIP